MGNNLTVSEMRDDGASPGVWLLDKLPFTWQDSTALKSQKNTNIQNRKQASKPLLAVALKTTTPMTTATTVVGSEAKDGVSITPTRVIVGATDLIRYPGRADGVHVNNDTAAKLSETEGAWVARVKNATTEMRVWDYQSASTWIALLKKTGPAPDQKSSRRDFQVYAIVVSQFNSILRPQALISEQHIAATSDSGFRRVFRLHYTLDDIDDKRLELSDDVSMTDELFSDAFESGSSVTEQKSSIKTMSDLINVYEVMQLSGIGITHTPQSLVSDCFSHFCDDPQDLLNLVNPLWKVGRPRLIGIVKT